MTTQQMELFAETHLADDVGAYEGGERRRPPGDALGLRGLPESRGELDRLVEDLCARLRSAGARPVTGRRLAEELQLAHGARAVRALVIYAQIHRGRRQIVGQPGTGYYWGDNVPGLYERMAAEARRRGRHAFYRAKILSGRSVARVVVETLFGSAGEADDDELAAAIAAEGDAGRALLDVVDAAITELCRTETGRSLAVRKLSALLAAPVHLPGDPEGDRTGREGSCN